MINRINFTAILWVLLIALTGAINGQDTDEGQSARVREVSSLDRVRILMSAGDFHGAAAYLELIKQTGSESFRYDDLLAICYRKTAQYLKLQTLLKTRLDKEGRQFNLVRDYGDACLLNGNIDSAQGYFYEAAALSQGRPDMLESMANAFYKLGHHEQEVRFIDSVRIIFNDPNLLAMRRGDALAAQKMFVEAATEYLDRIESDTLENKEIADRLIALIEYPESVDSVMSLLSRRMRGKSPNRRLMDIYGQMLMEQGHSDAAFGFYRERDSLGNNSGSDILNFMRECSLREKSEYVIEAGNYLLKRRPEATSQMTLHVLMAEAYIRLGQYEQALASYQTVLENSRRLGDRASAQVEIGHLYKNYLKNLSMAKKYYSAVLEAYSNSGYGFTALFGLADVYVRERQFDSSVVCYDSLIRQALPEDMAEEAHYYLSRVYLYQGYYDQANQQFRRLINKFPRGLYVNDAIQMVLILDESVEQAGDQMDLFSSAEYYHHIGSSDSLEYYLKKICRVGIPSLAPVSYLNLAQLYNDRQNDDLALEALDSLIASYPDSYFYPFGLKAKAEILWKNEKSREKARSIYKNILENYGTYPFTAEIREILRRQDQINQL